jgi:hypothetical protein
LETLSAAFSALALPAFALAPLVDAPFSPWRIGRYPSLALTAFPPPALFAFAPVLADHCAHSALSQ